MDIRNTEELSIIMSEESIDTVFHLAARSGVRTSFSPFVYKDARAQELSHVLLPYSRFMAYIM